MLAIIFIIQFFVAKRGGDCVKVIRKETNEDVKIVGHFQDCFMSDWSWDGKQKVCKISHH